MKNIFIENLYANCDGETILRPFSKKLKLIISLDQQSENLYSMCLLYVQVKDYQNMLKLRS